MSDFSIGPVIGASLGSVLGLWLGTHYHGQRLHKQLAAALDQGPDAARRLIDERIPAVEELPMMQAQRQAQRAAALGLLGDSEALEREARRHVGALHTWGYVGATSWMAFCAAGGAPERAMVELATLHARLEREERLVLRISLKRLARARLLVSGLQAQVDSRALRDAADRLHKEAGCVGVLASGLLERGSPGAPPLRLDAAGRRLVAAMDARLANGDAGV